MKKVLRKGLKFFCFVLIFAVLFLWLQELLRGKWFVGGKENAATTSTYREYRSLEEDTLDVLFIGTSHTYYGIDPMNLYEKTGITSYALGGQSLRMDMVYLSLREALRTQKPKVIFLDMSSIHYQKPMVEARMHMVLDEITLDGEKLDFILNTDAEDLGTLGAIFPFFRYHDRWKGLKETDFQYISGESQDPPVRGHNVSYYQVPATMKIGKVKQSFAVSDRFTDYFDRFVKLCEDEGIELIIYKIPAPGWHKNMSEASRQLADKYGLKYWELCEEIDAIGLDLETDFCDATDHLNQYGAEKLATYLGDYLKQNYDFADRRGQCERWDNDLKEYHEYLKKAWDTRFEAPAFEAEEVQEE